MSREGRGDVRRALDRRCGFASKDLETWRRSKLGEASRSLAALTFDSDPFPLRLVLKILKLPVSLNSVYILYGVS